MREIINTNIQDIFRQHQYSVSQGWSWVRDKYNTMEKFNEKMIILNYHLRQGEALWQDCQFLRDYVTLEAQINAAPLQKIDKLIAQGEVQERLLEEILLVQKQILKVLEVQKSA